MACLAFCFFLAFVCFACCCRCLRSVAEPVTNSACARLSLSARSCCCLLVCCVLFVPAGLRLYRKMLGVGVDVLAFSVFASFRFCLVRTFEASHSSPLALIRIFATSCHHWSLSAAFFCRSGQLMSSSTSMSKSPARLYSCICLTACLIILSSFIRRMWPSHFFRRARIHHRRLKVVVALEASSCLVRPVICDSMYALAPFIILHVSSSSGHASDPYVSMEQQPDM